MQAVFVTYRCPVGWGRFRKRNLKHAKECSIQQRRGFACGVCRWKRRFGCSRNSAVSAARFESGFRERDGQGQHWRGPHSHGGFLKMIVCESGGHANGLTCFIFRFLRRPLGCSFWVKHRVRETLTPRLRLVVGQPSNEKRSFPPDARLHLGKAARNGPTARFERVSKGAGRATSRKRRHGPPVRSPAVRVFEWRGGQANRGINGG